MITQEFIKSILHYEQETGVFKWISRTSNRINIGDIAGSNKSFGYRQIKVSGKLYCAHRLAFLYVFGRFPLYELDHINGNVSDNRISNLREASRQENMKNRGLYANNSSGYKGVYFMKSNKRWISAARLNGKNNYLGAFKSALEASNAYQDFAKKHHGEFLYKDSKNELI